jgi:hypothetical protein
MSLSEVEPPPSMEAVAAEGARLARVWADGTAVEREAAYRYVESAVREAVASGGDAQHGRAAALAAACVAPLSELSAADSARVDATEWRRVILLVGELVALDAIPGVNRDGYVSAELYRPGEWMALFRCHENPRGAFAELVAKEPGAWTRDDALTVAAYLSRFVPSCVVGVTPILAKDDTVSEVAFIEAWVAQCPILGLNASPSDRFLPLMLLVLELLREPRESLPSGIVCGAWHCLCWMPMLGVGAPPTVAKALWEAGFVEVFLAHLHAFSPEEQIGRTHIATTSMFCALKDVVQGAQAAGVDVVRPLLDVGAIDIALSTLTAYQSVGDAEAVSVTAVAWGTLLLLETLAFRGSAAVAKEIVEKLRAESRSTFMYLLDHP